MNLTASAVASRRVDVLAILDWQWHLWTQNMHALSHTARHLIWSDWNSKRVTYCVCREHAYSPSGRGFSSHNKQAFSCDASLDVW